ncbi:LLM class flavin-dependent oxidoreductase [Rhodococcus sp. IEGM 1366]|uniref:LLM class flavin-dependent oxidoreductase n=1 Tax=Rhodococcus sp. IEGM 1366 TaxID=3082223 RepID=UPI00398A062F
MSTACYPIGPPPGVSAVRWQLHFDTRSSAQGVGDPELYRGAHEMAEWGDHHGMHQVLFSEHHGAADGYLPSPMVMAGALSAATEHCTVALKALVLTLKDPAAAAEDAAVVDQLSNGRLEIRVVPGYAQADFAMYGVDPKVSDLCLRVEARGYCCRACG